MQSSKRLEPIFNRLQGVSSWGGFKYALLGATLLLAAGCGVQPYDPAPDGQPRTVVVWISVDGVRPDYFERARTPFFDRLMSEGAYSLALAPMFPSLTFPNHVSQATGVPVAEHGVSLNTFHDRVRGRSYSFPNNPELLDAEPIWNTAQRQGRRTAVFDWVLSHLQTGPDAASFFGTGYDGSLSDRDRIRPLLGAWRRDRDSQPLQLFMGYMPRPDQVGHSHGPDSREIGVVMRETDSILSGFTRQVIRMFERRMAPQDELYLIITSDHGMSPVHTVVNPRLLTGISREEEQGDDIIMTTSGNMAHVFLHTIADPVERAQREEVIYNNVSPHSFVRIYRPHELPEHWAYNHPDRTGDLVIILDTGYTFNRRAPELTATPDETASAVGMHGYCVLENPEMNGILLVWRYREPIGGIDLGPTHSLQLHATVAHLLDIDPAPGAQRDRIRW